MCFGMNWLERSTGETTPRALEEALTVEGLRLKRHKDR